jgi:hypothetical protein
MSLFLTDTGATTVVRSRGAGDVAWSMHVVGHASRPPVASEPLAAKANYFVGSDPARWRTGAPTFGRVTVPDVLPGVSQVFHGDSGALEYDFEVAPGARPESIAVAFDGVDALELDRGTLKVHEGGEVFEQPPPHVYTRGGGEELAVAGCYRLVGARTVAFDIGAYDATKTLVIDPILAYSTYLGGAGDDAAYGIAVDRDGAIYVTGITSSTNFPVTPQSAETTLRGSVAAFVTKLSPDGQSIVYSTYLGGSDGAYGYGIAVDATGAAYVVGATNSSDFPTVTPLQAARGGSLDGFVAKLTPDGGALAYSTYLGGEGEDTAYGVAVDANDAAYVVGRTSGAFPLTKPAQPTFGGGVDAFVVKLSASGSSFEYSTYVGGSADDDGYGVAVDSSGAAYLTGYTQSLDFPVAPAAGALQSLLNGSQNAFVAKLAPSGATFAYSTYLGGSQADQGSAIAVDATGAAYVTGAATSPDFPVKSGFQPALHAKAGTSNAFVTKIDATGTALAYSTFLGGSGPDVGTGIAVDIAGHAYVVGSTGSLDFPVARAVQGANAARQSGGTNAFVTEVTASDADLVYSSYLGGAAGDSAQAVALVPGATPPDAGTGTAYVAGYTVSPDFPAVNALQPAFASVAGDNAFVAAIGPALLAGDAGAKPVDAGRAEDISPPPVGGGDASEPVADAGGTGISTAAGDGCDCSAAGRAASGGDGGADARSFAAAVALALAVGRRRRYGPAPS